MRKVGKSPGEKGEWPSWVDDAVVPEKKQPQQQLNFQPQKQQKQQQQQQQQEEQEEQQLQVTGPYALPPLLPLHRI